MGSQGEAASSGWPLGLPPLHFQMRLAEALNTAELNSYATSTPSFSSSSSSDLDTESTLSFFPEKRVTLGSLIGLENVDLLSLSRSLNSLRSKDGRSGRQSRHRSESSRFWSVVSYCGCSCRNYNDDTGPSLGHFLQTERRAAGSHDRSEKVYVNIMFEEEPTSFACEANPNPLFDAYRALEEISSNVPAADFPAMVGENPEPVQHKLPAAGFKRKDRRTKYEGACVVDCVSHMWQLPKSTPWKTNSRQSDETSTRWKTTSSKRSCSNQSPD